MPDKMPDDLRKVVENMIEAGESDDNIALVIREYPGLKKKSQSNEVDQKSNEPLLSDLEEPVEPSTSKSAEDRLLEGTEGVEFSPVQEEVKNPLELPSDQLAPKQNLETPELAVKAQEKVDALNAVDSGQNRVEDAAARFDQAVLGFPGEALKALGIGGAMIKNAFTGDAKAENDILFQLGDKYNNFIKEIVPSNPALEGELQAQVAKALGDLAVMYSTGGTSQATSLTSKAPSIIKDFFSGPALSGAVLTGVSEYDQAKQSGATEDQAFDAFIENAAFGSVLERLPVQSFWKRFDTVTDSGLKEALSRGVVGGAEEAVTEVLQQGYSNLNAQQSYDYTRKITDGMGEAGSIGGGLGFLINALGGSLKLKQKQSTNKLEHAKLQEAIDLVESKKPASGPENKVEIKETLDNRNEHIARESIDVLVEKVNNNVGDLVNSRLNEISDNNTTIKEPVNTGGNNIAGSTEVSDVRQGSEINTDQVAEAESGTRERSIGKKFLESPEVSEEVKEGLSKEGIDYVPRKEAMVEEEAKGYIEAFEEAGNLDAALSHVYNTKNEMKLDTRTVVASQLYLKLQDKAKQAQTPEERAVINNKIVQLAKFAQEKATEIGQGTNAQKSWKKALFSDPASRVILAEATKRAEIDNKINESKINVKKTETDLNNFIKENIEEIVKRPEVKYYFRNAKAKAAEAKAKIKDAWDSKLLKDDKGVAYDATYLIAKKVYNGAIRTMKQMHLAGATTKAIIEKGIAYVKAKHNGSWKEQDFRTDFEGLISKQDKQSPEISDAIITGSLQDNIGNIIKKHYSEVSEIKKSLKSKLIEDLGISSESASKIEEEIELRFENLANKKKAQLLEKLKENGIKGPINVRKLTELANIGALDSDATKSIVADGLGIKEYTTEVKQKILNLSETIKATEDIATELQKKDGWSKEKYNEFLERSKESNQALRDLNNIVDEKLPLADKLISMMQGGLLTSTSLATNVYANYALQPFRFAALIAETGLDIAYSSLLKKERQVYFMARQKGFFKGKVKGLKTGVYELFNGLNPEQISTFEIKQGFEPMRSWAKGISAAKAGNALEAANELTYATFGTTSEVMFRFLNMGDRPLSMAAGMAKSYEIAARKGLKGAERDQFIAFPDQESAVEIKKATEEATFQDKNRGADWINKGVSMIDDIDNEAIRTALKVLAKSQIPFTKTPLNLAAETIKFAMPPVSLAQGLYKLNKGDREGLKDISKAMIGAMISGLTYMLFSNGLITALAPEKEKERDMMYLENPPSGINITGFRRLLSGGSPDTQSGDTWLSYEKAGIVGTTMGIYATGFESSRKKGVEMNAGEFSKQLATITNLPVTAKVLISQSFLHGTQTLLNAIQSDGKALDKWLISTSNALSAIAVPNTVAQISRANNENMADVRAEKFEDAFVKNLKNRWFQGDKLTSRIDMWGQPIKQTPDESNWVVYNFFGVTKARELRKDESSYKLYQLMKETNEVGMVPSKPTKPFPEMTDEEFEIYQMEVGKIRKSEVDTFVNSSDWDNYSSEDKIKELKSIYRDATNEVKENLGIEDAKEDEGE